MTQEKWDSLQRACETLDHMVNHSIGVLLLTIAGAIIFAALVCGLDDFFDLGGALKGIVCLGFIIAAGIYLL